MPTEFLNRERILRAFSKSAEYETLNIGSINKIEITAEMVLADCDEVIFGWDLKFKVLAENLAYLYEAEDGSAAMLTCFRSSQATVGDLIDVILAHSKMNSSLKAPYTPEKLYSAYVRYCAKIKHNPEPRMKTRVNKVVKIDWTMANWLIFLLPEAMQSPKKVQKLSLLPVAIKWHQRGNLVFLAGFVGALMIAGARKVDGLTFGVWLAVGVAVSLHRFYIIMRKFPSLSKFRYTFIPGATTLTKALESYNHL